MFLINVLRPMLETCILGLICFGSPDATPVVVPTSTPLVVTVAATATPTVMPVTPTATIMPAVEVAEAVTPTVEAAEAITPTVEVAEVITSTIVHAPIPVTQICDEELFTRLGIEPVRQPNGLYLVEIPVTESLPFVKFSSDDGVINGQVISTISGRGYVGFSVVETAIQATMGQSRINLHVCITNVRPLNEWIDYEMSMKPGSVFVTVDSKGVEIKD